MLFVPVSLSVRKSRLTQGEYILALNKETNSLGMSWEQEYGYAQTVKVGEAIYISGQMSHDDLGL